MAPPTHATASPPLRGQKRISAPDSARRARLTLAALSARCAASPPPPRAKMRGMKHSNIGGRGGYFPPLMRHSL
eukprot:2993487-Prymnesium_polylepis.1